MNIDPISARAVDRMLRTDHMRSLIISEAAYLGPGVLELLEKSGVSISAIEPGKHLSDYAAKAKHYGIKVPVGASGVFLPSEATLYMITESRATAVHELAHALDFVLGAGRMAKDREPSMKTQIDREFATGLRGNGRAPTEYGQTNTQEFFAESVRAYCGIDDAGSVFSAASPAKLRSLNRRTFLFVTKLMVGINGRRFEGSRAYRADFLPSALVVS